MSFDKAGGEAALESPNGSDFDPVPGAGRRVLLLAYHRDGVETATLLPGTGVVIGRESPDADLVVPDPTLSRRHARFSLAEGDDGGVTVEDLCSRNGTWVGGREVERSTVEMDETVRLGGVTAALHVVAGAEPASLELDGHDAFRAAVEAELVRAEHFKRGCAVITVRCLRRKDGHLHQWWPAIRGLVRKVDRFARYGPDTVEILLPEVAREEAQKAARAIATPREGRPPLACGVAVFPGAAITADKLLEVSRESAMKADAASPVRFAPEEESQTWVPIPAARGEDRLFIRSDSMLPVVEAAKRLSRVPSTVLLLGEMGTGKEVMARFIHEAGPRGRKPMICVNCGAIPAQLLESTLFGHERGSFTGAQQRVGVFEAANGGTLLLDEIGELPLAAQAALLRVLEDRQVTRLGANREIHLNVRVIAATNRDLGAMVKARTFRHDLFERLNGIELRLPPLRERREDVEPLALCFLEQTGKANGRRLRGVDQAALALLEGYGWPGNIRELRNVIDRAVVLAEGDVITPTDLPERVVHGAGRAKEEGDTRPITRTVDLVPDAESLKSQVARFEKGAILNALRETGGNVTEAARFLAMPVRTLQYKIQKTYGIKLKRVDCDTE
jgi:DNA-binding NtrC family response regulator